MSEVPTAPGFVRIPMTGRRPVEIEEVAWPVLGSARYVSEHLAGAEGAMILRRHTDGRYLVSGSSAGPLGPRVAGLLVPVGGDVVEAIKEVAADIGCPGTSMPGELFACLPAERI